MKNNLSFDQLLKQSSPKEAIQNMIMFGSRNPEMLICEAIGQEI